MSEDGRAMNRMGWVIALAGAWALAALGVVGATYHGGGSTPDCLPGFYLSGGWCVRDPQPADAPSFPAHFALVKQVGRISVGPVGIEPTTEGL